MKITSSVEYATRIMVALARSHGGAKLPAEKLSESENVPVDYVNQILLRLRRAGLVESHRGLGGGYSLAREPSRVTLGEVARAVEGRIFEDVCGRYDEGEKDCHHQGNCSISPVWHRLGAMIEEYFDGISLSRLLEEQGTCGKVAVMLDKISPGKK